MDNTQPREYSITLAIEFPQLNGAVVHVNLLGPSVSKSRSDTGIHAIEQLLHERGIYIGDPIVARTLCLQSTRHGGKKGGVLNDDYHGKPKGV